MSKARCIPKKIADNTNCVVRLNSVGTNIKYEIDTARQTIPKMPINKRLSSKRLPSLVSDIIKTVLHSIR